MERDLTNPLQSIGCMGVKVAQHKQPCLKWFHSMSVFSSTDSIGYLTLVCSVSTAEESRGWTILQAHSPAVVHRNMHSFKHAGAHAQPDCHTSKEPAYDYDGSCLLVRNVPAHSSANPDSRISSSRPGTPTSSRTKVRSAFAGILGLPGLAGRPFSPKPSLPGIVSSHLSPVLM